MRNITELRKALRAHKLLDHERILAENVLEQIKDGGEVGVKATLLAIVSSSYNSNVYKSLKFLIHHRSSATPPNPYFKKS